METIDPGAWKHLEHMTAHGTCLRSCLLGCQSALRSTSYGASGCPGLRGRPCRCEWSESSGKERGMGSSGWTSMARAAALGSQKVFLPDLCHNWSLEHP